MALKDFLAPFGSSTNIQYGANASPVAQVAMQQPGQFAGALSNNFTGYMNGLGQAAGAYTAGMNGYVGGLGALGQAGSNAYGSYANGIGQLGNSASQMYGANAQGLAQLGKSYADAYGASAAGLGNVAGAMSNEKTGFYNANSQAEAARQLANANIGSAALGAYGGASSGALSAWAQDRAAYNKSLSDLASANQMASATYGQSRNNALGMLGTSYADTTKGLGGALAIGNINFAMNGGGTGGGGNDFTATGPDGQIASGSYSGGGGGGGFSATGSRTSNTDGVKDLVNPAYGGLGSLRDSLMAGDITGSMNSNYLTGLGALRADHARGENMPSSLLDQSFHGLQDLANAGYRQNQGGMDQYYGTQNGALAKSDYSGILGQLASGYQSAGRQIGSAQNDMNRNYGSGLGMLAGLAPQLGSGYQSAMGDLRGYGNQMADAFKQNSQNLGGVVGKMDSGFGSSNAALSGLWDKSMGNTELFQSPAEIANSQRQADLLKQQYAADDARKRDVESAATRAKLVSQFGADKLKSWGLG